MTLTDWTIESGAGATQERATSGSYSIKIDGSNSPKVTLDQSEADAPTEVDIQTQAYLDGSSPAYVEVGLVFNYQDADNFCVLVFEEANSIWEVQEVVNGATNTVSADNPSVTVTGGSWTSLTLTTWTDSGNRFCRAKQDGEQLAPDLSFDNSLIDSSLRGGGGVGISCSGHQWWADETEVYY
jgi:hypothetical protein